MRVSISLLLKCRHLGHIFGLLREIATPVNRIHDAKHLTQVGRVSWQVRRMCRRRLSARNTGPGRGHSAATYAPAARTECLDYPSG